MGNKRNKTSGLDLTGFDVPEDLTDLYHGVREVGGGAMQRIKDGETTLQVEWRLAARLCRQFLGVTEEPAQLAFASGLGDWERARVSDEPPDDEYTYQLWLAAQAWRVLEYCRRGRERRFIEPVRHFAREGIVNVKSASTLSRTMAYQALRDEHKIEDRVRGPKLEKAGKSRSVRKRRKRNRKATSGD